MRKYVLDLRVTSVEQLSERYLLLAATNPAGPLPEMCPGQFAQLRIDDSKETFLRRPISLHHVDYERNEVSFLIQKAGKGTASLWLKRPGSTLNVILPLGNGFTMPKSLNERILLVGGGVGIAPLLFMGEAMQRMGVRPTFLLGARSKSDLLLLDKYRALGTVYVTTEDGSEGEKGFVTQHSILQNEKFDSIAVCGPKPMMMAMASYAKQAQIPCEVSLENVMACGLGACLCCVEETKDGNVCVCKEGPVFDIEKLKW
ncbi:MAG: dihydroorotate dehydrogenase electron transfer subunit [Bacteroidaceae bacterium]|nr:dihydroorotate dehydrogenase electron transfer subunit [Bacteroidaceae bacterium]